MAFLEQLQSDLKKAVLAHQHDLLLEVLRGRSAELTLGDLRKLLASPLGRGLDDVRVAALLGEQPTSPRTAEVKAATRKRGAGKKSRKPTEPTRKARAKATKAKPVVDKSSAQDLLDTVMSTLEAAKKPLSSPQIAAKVKVHRTSVRKALNTLSAQKRVTITGSRQFTRYAPSGRATVVSEEPAGKRRAKSTTKASKPRSAATRRQASNQAGGEPTARNERPASPASLSQADYDAAVLANLRATGSMSSSQLQASVGGTLDQVRGALQRLISQRQATRVGARKTTRYVPYGPKHPETSDA